MNELDELRGHGRMTWIEAEHGRVAAPEEIVNALSSDGFEECRRYIALLRLAIGPEPDGARLRVRRSDTDFDPYIDVVVEYDDQNPAASDYALRCERDAPTRWREAPGPTVESAKTPEEPIVSIASQ